MITYADTKTVYDKAFCDHLVSTAKMNRILYQTVAGQGEGTDAAAVMRVREGIRCAAVSVPVRYIHSAGAVMQESDYDTVKALLRAQLRRMAN